jgi:hypothetical protein
MPPDVALAGPTAAASIDVCAQGGAVIVAAFAKIIDVAKYLFGASIFLAAAIWLVSEFLREADRGGFKVAGFLLHAQLPLLLLLLTVGLLLGVPPSVFGAGLAKPC